MCVILRDIVIRQLVTLEGVALPLPAATRPPTAVFAINATVRNVDGFKPASRFYIKHALRKVLCLVDGFDNEAMTYSLGDLCSALSKYILGNKARFLDSRNPPVCMCGIDDPLGQAFGVSAFHRSQVW